MNCDELLEQIKHLENMNEELMNEIETLYKLNAELRGHLRKALTKY